MGIRSLLFALSILALNTPPGLGRMVILQGGNWPADWPGELEPYRKRVETWSGGPAPHEGRPVPVNSHRIQFSERPDFEKAWPALLKVKSEGAPLSLYSANEGSSAVQIFEFFPTPEEKDGYAIGLYVDGTVIDLNRIRFPGDTPIVDWRQFAVPQNQPGTRPSGTTDCGSSTTLWDIRKEGRFDWTRKSFAIDNDRVVVDVQDEKSLCPLGFRGRSRIGEAVREIVFRYEVAGPGHYWLHIIWHPAGSGKEQFEVLLDRVAAGKSQLVNGSETPGRETTERFALTHVTGAHEIQLRWLSGDGLRFSEILLTRGQELTARTQPTKKTRPFPTIASLNDYEKEIKEPGIIIDGKHVRFYAPRRMEKQARIVHGYLVRAYDELHRIVGSHTKDTIVVYSLPKDSPYRLGRTGNCKIWYTYENIQFETQPEWQKHRIPHVSGYIEEMAHNFVGATLATFGNEAVGWSISRIVSKKVADNPVYQKSLDNARRIQADTFADYKRLNNTFPPGIAPSLCDRIHAHLLYLCEQEYGPRFWPDFFEEVRKARKELEAAHRSGTGDERRNARYRVTIECFDRLVKGRFKEMLAEHGVSLTTDVVSLRFKRPDWDRKLVEKPPKAVDSGEGE